MKILERRVYRGPNLYAHFPVIRMRVDLGRLEQHPTGKLPGFVDELLSTVPSLVEHTCSYGTHGGFVRRMSEAEGTWMGHVLEHVPHPCAFGLAHAPHEAAVRAVRARVLDERRHRAEQLVDEAGQLARRMLLESTEVDAHPYHWEVGIEVGTTVDATLEDLHGAQSARAVRVSDPL